MNACATAAGGCGVFHAGFLKQEVGLGVIFSGISVVFVIAGLLLAVGYRTCIRSDIARAQTMEAGRT